MNQSESIFEQLRKTRQSGKTPAEHLSAFMDYLAGALGEVEANSFEYKEKDNRSHPKLDPKDIKHLAITISAFSNSSGGVLIWGIENKTLKPKPIAEVREFAERVSQAMSSIVEPAVMGLDLLTFAADSGEGYLALYIPESELPPHRVTSTQAGSDAKDRYYIRSGGNSVVADHSQLNDMFGRRPHPNLVLTWRGAAHGTSMEGRQIDARVILTLQNLGRGSARAPYLEIDVQKPFENPGVHDELDGSGHAGLRILAVPTDFRGRRYAGGDDIVIHPGMALDITALAVLIKDDEFIRPTFGLSDIKVKYKIAAEGLPIDSGILKIDYYELIDQARASANRRHLR